MPKKTTASKKPASQAQARLAWATLEGAKTGMPKKVAQEFVNGIHGKKLKSLPKRAKAKKK